MVKNWPANAGDIIDASSVPGLGRSPGRGHGTPLQLFSRQEYWSRLPCPPPGDLLDPGIELSSLMSPVLAGQFFTTSATWEALSNSIYPKLVMYISRLEQLWEFLNDCNLESQLGKSPRPCIHPVGETSHCSFGDSCL